MAPHTPWPLLLALLLGLLRSLQRLALLATACCALLSPPAFSASNDLHMADEVALKIISLSRDPAGNAYHQSVELLLEFRGSLPDWVNKQSIEDSLKRQLPAGSRVYSQSAPWYETQDQDKQRLEALQQTGALVHVQLNPSGSNILDLFITTWSLVSGRVAQSEGAFGSVEASQTVAESGGESSPSRDSRTPRLSNAYDSRMDDRVLADSKSRVPRETALARTLRITGTISGGIGGALVLYSGGFYAKNRFSYVDEDTWQDAVRLNNLGWTLVSVGVLEWVGVTLYLETTQPGLVFNGHF